LAIITDILANQRRLGFLFVGLLGDRFVYMPKPSGMLFAVNVPTALITTKIRVPGDIDILIVPYHGADLILDQVTAIEVKVIRAKHAAAGRSPNRLGFSQAHGLLDAGFPYAALLHVMVSDVSPSAEWVKLKGFRVVNSETGEVVEDEDVFSDPLPSILMDRGIGRLNAGRSKPELGIGCIYTEAHQSKPETQMNTGFYLPEAEEASLNPLASERIAERCGRLVEKYPDRFVNLARWDPA
jgi:hypothetical protein